MYNHLGEYNQAKELHKKALTIRRTIFSEDHNDVATSSGNLASVHSSLLEENSQGEKLSEKALMIFKEIFW